ncbi:MAG TPA: heavy metal translocating P-type ATPase metal-binding domain-containing protein, partial [Flavobacteriaceae bacterium]|nr:heavy metal translocating P-type ATPase metal-binding domain-containing protein [Flavobacteriaceae bacterium]
MSNCFHCGDPCLDHEIKKDDKVFCCHGCKTVFEILHENDLGFYYDLEKNPGITPEEIEGKFDFLDNAEISEKLLEFNDGNTAVISFS